MHTVLSPKEFKLPMDAGMGPLRLGLSSILISAV